MCYIHSKPSALHLLLHVLHIQIHSLLIHLHRSVMLSCGGGGGSSSSSSGTCSNAAWKAPNACGVPDFTITRRFLRQRVSRHASGAGGKVQT
jgi:hypothetical protein